MKHILFTLVVLIHGALAQHAASPNILFIFSDDHALKAISAYGGNLKEIAPTPHIDRLANEGALFQNSFCANSICGPSRACIITGKHSHVNGYLSNDFDTFDGNQQTLPKLLQSSGYQTAVIGKWHLVSDPQGFDHWSILPGQGSYYNPNFIDNTGSKRINGYCTDLITDMSLEWLKNRRDPDKPFFLMCQHKAPHRNWSPALRHIQSFSDVSIPEPDNLFDDYANRDVSLTKQEMSIAKDLSWANDMKFHGENLFPQHFTDIGPNLEYERMDSDQKRVWDKSLEPENQAFIDKMNKGQMNDADITRWKYQRYMKHYLSTIRAVDESVGRMLDYLESSGLAQNTIVIYSADQGFYLGEHGWYDKRWMFEESLKMPFIIRWPKVIQPGARPKALIQNIDYAPTFLDMIGKKAPPDMQGKSFLATLKDESKKHHDAIYYAYYGENTHRVAQHDGIRTENHKLIYFPYTNQWNLFDLQKDPHEMKSLHDSPDTAETLSELKKIYHQKRSEYKVNAATTPTMRLTTPWWKERHSNITKKVKAIRKGDAPQPKIVLLGDSITQAWEGNGKRAIETQFPSTPILNLGFSGDQTQHVLWRLYNGEFDGIKPEFVSLMIGTNNTGQTKQNAAETALGIRMILDFIRDRSPNTKILLHAIFPRGAEPTDELRLINDQINQISKSYADQKSIFWLDMAPEFLTPQGILEKSTMPDFLHLNTSSYDKWANRLRQELQNIGWKN